MLNLQEKIKAFVKLGELLREFSSGYYADDEAGRKSDPQFQKLESALLLAGQKNGWFTVDQVLFAFEFWGKCLEEKNLKGWLSPYNISGDRDQTVALILAGNIPLVGFHDLLAVVLSGHKALIKLSSNDDILLPALVEILDDMVQGMKDLIRFEEERLSDFDKVIATGSNNTARYFEYYFSSKPNIIRKNRNSVALLTGNETRESLEALGQDVFQYYGLGCRSVSKIFVPQGYSFDVLFNAFEPYKNLIEERKYHNNYDYNKAIYLMSAFPFLDNGFLLLKEDPGYASPIGTLFYEYYQDLETVKAKLRSDQDKIQCIVAQEAVSGAIAFGQTQYPGLSDYADGRDTVEFLLKT